METRSPTWMSFRVTVASPFRIFVSERTSIVLVSPVVVFTVMEWSETAVTVPRMCTVFPCANAREVRAIVTSAANKIFFIGRSPLVLSGAGDSCLWGGTAAGTVEKFLLCFFFLDFGWTARIEPLHVENFRRRQIWKMANEQDKLPAVVIVRGVAPGRHAGPSHPVVNDGKDFAVIQLLGGRQSHVGHWRIEIFPHLGIAASVVPVARRAVICEMLGGFLEHFRRWLKRIFPFAIRSGYRQRAQPPCE